MYLNHETVWKRTDNYDVHNIENMNAFLKLEMLAAFSIWKFSIVISICRMHEYCHKDFKYPTHNRVSNFRQDFDMNLWNLGAIFLKFFNGLGWSIMKITWSKISFFRLDDVQNVHHFLWYEEWRMFRIFIDFCQILFVTTGSWLCDFSFYL